MKESLSVNVCKIFVRPLKYLLLLYNLPADGGTCNCFYSKFGKGTSFLCVQKGDWNSVSSLFISGCP